MITMKKLFDSVKFKKTINLFLAVLLLSSCGQSDCGTASESVAAKSYKWKMVTSWPKNFPGLGITPEKFAQYVKDMSNGRLTVQVYGAGEIVPGLEVFDAVSQGTVQMGHSGAYYWKGKMPAAPKAGFRR